MSAVIEESIGRSLKHHEFQLLLATGFFRWGDPGTDAWCNNELGGGVWNTEEALAEAGEVAVERSVVA